MKTATVTSSGTTMVLEKVPAVGGNGGVAFDTGCSPDGVKNLHIIVGGYHKGDLLLSIKRIYVDSMPTNDQENIYHAFPTDDSSSYKGALANKTFTLSIGPNDCIKKANE